MSVKSSSQSRPHRATEHSAEEWDRQRGVFTDLYAVKRLKLNEVKRLMSAKHGFHATERQYKRKIVLWKLEKNVKAKDKSLMIRKKQQRMFIEGKESKFVLNGREVEDRKLHRFLRTQRDIVEPYECSPMTPTNIICITPSKSTGLCTKSKSVARRTHEPASKESPPSPKTIQVNKLTMHYILPEFDPDALGQFNSVPRSPPSRAGEKYAKIDDLGEFFATWTCMIWFLPWERLSILKENKELLYSCEEMRTLRFTSWAQTIFQTITLSMNGIFLAILNVYRLRAQNPNIVGKEGSEFRVAIVALLLANKISEDLCYTNKTWGEVSGISVAEICTMEIEFLSNVQYNLYVSGEDWEDWAQILKSHFRVLQEHRNASRSQEDIEYRCGQSREATLKLLEWIDQPRLEDETTSSKVRQPTEHEDAKNYSDCLICPTQSNSTPYDKERSNLSTPKISNTLPELSPSQYFSPKTDFAWPSFCGEPSDLSDCVLQHSADGIIANPLPLEDHRWRPLQAPRSYFETGSIPTIDGLWDLESTLDCPPIW